MRNAPPRASNQVSLYQSGYLVTSLPHVESDCDAVAVVDLTIELARKGHSSDQ